MDPSGPACSWAQRKEAEECITHSHCVLPTIFFQLVAADYNRRVALVVAASLLKKDFNSSCLLSSRSLISLCLYVEILIGGLFVPGCDLFQTLTADYSHRKQDLFIQQGATKQFQILLF